MSGMGKIVIFYEKPGCATNAKQKKSLRDAGCIVIERNLLDHGMNVEELYTFFKGMPVASWFNPNAPKVKSGEIDVNAFDERSALKLLMMEPILIKRPLMVFNGVKLCGFDQKAVESHIGLPLQSTVATACSGSHEPCPEPKPTFRMTR